MTQDQLNISLFKAVKKGDIALVKKAIEEGANVNAKNKDGVTPLYIAARNGLKELGNMLIDKGGRL